MISRVAKKLLIFRLPAGKSVTFRYRTIITSGIHLNDEEINILADDFAGTIVGRSLILKK